MTSPYPGLTELPCSRCGKPHVMSDEAIEEGLESICRDCWLRENPDLAWMIPAGEAAARQVMREQCRAIVAKAERLYGDATQG